MDRELIQANIDAKREQHRKSIKIASRANALAASWTLRLKKIGLLARLFDPRAKRVKLRIQRQASVRFIHTAVAMNMARSIKFLERRLKESLSK